MSRSAATVPRRLWAALDERADAQRVTLARLLTALQRRAADNLPASSPVPTAAAIGENLRNRKHVSVDVTSLSKGTVSDVVRTLCGKSNTTYLHPESLRCVLHAAASQEVATCQGDLEVKSTQNSFPAAVEIL